MLSFQPLMGDMGACIRHFVNSVYFINYVYVLVKQEARVDLPSFWRRPKNGEERWPVSGVNWLVVQRQLNLGWIWVALYTMAGAFTLMHLFAHFAIQTPHLFNLGAAGFLGATFVSRFSDGRALKECLLAALALAFGLVVVSSLPHHELAIAEAATYTRMLSSMLVVVSAALGGSRLGAIWARRVAYEGRTISGAVLAAVVLVGALVCHVALIAIFEEVSHGLAVFLILLSIITTPAFAGAALQLSQTEPVEGQMGLGIALIAAVFLILIGLEVHSLGTLFLISIGFLGIGATIYSITLPGVFAVRSSSRWGHRCNDVPVAVAVVVKDAA